MLFPASNRLVRFLLCLTVLVLPSRALDPNKTLTQYAHRIWGQEEGLFQPTIYSILQTRDGFLWLGTQDSLIRFDGLHFREFDGAGESAFHHNLIRALLEDGDGNLWVGSIGAGIARIEPNGNLTRFTTKQGLPSDAVFCLARGAKTDIWVCTNQGLARFTSGHFHTYTTADGLPTNQVRATCESVDGTQWVAGVDFGLVRWNGSRFEAYSDPKVPEEITALECGQDGSIWVGSDSGLTQMRRDSSRVFSIRDGLPDNAISSLANGPDGSFWIGTNDGISRFQNGEISVYRTRDGLSHSLVLSLYIDREGSLWAGTKDGLDEFTDGKVTPYSTSEGMLSNDAGPVLEDGSGHLWIGTLGKGLNTFDGHRFRALTTRDWLIDNTILSLELDKSGDLWVGTAKGLNRLRNGKVVAAYTQANGLSGSQVRALFADARGALWAGTESGLDRFNGKRFAIVDTGPNVRKEILGLSGGRAVRLFVSTAAPALYYMRSLSLANYPLDVIHGIDCYYLDHDQHAAWMGTLGSGLLRWQNGALVHIRVKDGLYDNRIYSILKDDHANLWMASSKGIFRVSQKELEDFAEGKIHSLTSIPFSTGQLRFECQSGVQPAACRTRDGRLWFSTTNGVVMVDPNRLVRNNMPPPVQITAIIVNGERLTRHPNLQLKSFEKNVEIRYAGLSFVSPEKVAFRYMLDGYDRAWTEAGSRREAFFTNLPPGNFHFKVMARNADGIWSNSPAALAFSIEPRLYQRTWFIPALALIICLLIVAGYRLRIAHLNQRFHLVLAERNRIARELHDTLLQGLSGITLQLQAVWTRLPASKEKQILAGIIDDAGKCSREARQSLWGLRAQDQESCEFSDKLANLSRQAVGTRPISLVLDLEPVCLSGSPDLEYQLLRIAQQAITNTIRHAGATTLHIRLRASEQELKLTLEDDGTGFDTDEQAGALGRFGLIGMRERASEIGAKLTFLSSPGQGTNVSITVPLSRPVTSESNQEQPFEHHLT